MVGQGLHVPLQRTECYCFGWYVLRYHIAKCSVLLKGAGGWDAGTSAHVLISYEKLLSPLIFYVPLFSTFLPFKFLVYL